MIQAMGGTARLGELLTFGLHCIDALPNKLEAHLVQLHCFGQGSCVSCLSPPGDPWDPPAHPQPQPFSAPRASVPQHTECSRLHPHPLRKQPCSGHLDMEFLVTHVLPFSLKFILSCSTAPYPLSVFNNKVFNYNNRVNYLDCV